MPYGIRKVGNKYQVYEKAGGKHPGKVLGTVPTRARGKSMIRAIEANSHGG